MDPLFPLAEQSVKLPDRELTTEEQVLMQKFEDLLQKHEITTGFRMVHSSNANLVDMLNVAIASLEGLDGLEEQLLGRVIDVQVVKIENTS